MKIRSLSAFRRIAIAAVSGSALLTGAPVAAQDGNYLDAVTPYAHHQLHRYRGDEGEERDKEKAQRTFQASADVSRELNRTLAALLQGARPRNDIAESSNVQAVFAEHPVYRALLARQIGQDAREIEGNLDTGILQSRLSELLDKRDYASNDPVEVLNAYLVTAWRVVHDERQNAHDGSYRGLQRAMRNSEIEAPEVSRQQVAEMFGIINMLTLAAWRNAHDPADREALRSGTLMLAKRMSGVDLQTVVLTDRGFARRD